LNNRQRLEPNWLTRFIASDALPWLAAALALVVLRCAPLMVFEQLNFDSDQAVVGLMAKHLADGRHFPLFFYGQHYMLGVEAWMAAPFFLVGGPTVAMLRLPLMIVNVVVACWLLLHLTNRGVGAAWAFVATLPLIATGPVASALLMQTFGAIEPLFYLLVLWAVRGRPAVFGALFCVAYLHRELMLYALPALVIVWLLDGPRLDRAPAYVLKAALSFAAVWIGVAQLMQRINTLGPAGGEVVPGSLRAQSQMVIARLSFDSTAYLARLAAVIRGTLPDLYALHAAPLWLFGLHSTLAVGSVVGGIALGTGVAVAAARIAFARRSDATPRTEGRFYLYLSLVGVEAILAYALNGGIDPTQPGILRYLLFALLLPVAVLGVFVERERTRSFKIAVASSIVVWAAINVADNVRLIREYVVAPAPNEYRILADYLVSHRIRYGRADYWDAYITDFLSGERVILTATQVVRISSYDARVIRNAPNAVIIQHQPCDLGTRVASWCIDDPLRR
jgi:hypothetical protein